MHLSRKFFGDPQVKRGTPSQPRKRERNEAELFSYPSDSFRLASNSLFANDSVLFLPSSKIDENNVGDWLWDHFQIVPDTYDPEVTNLSLDAWLDHKAPRADMLILDAGYFGREKDGVEYAAGIRSVHKSLPFMLLSSQIGLNDFSSENAHTCDVMLRKPLSRTAFLMGAQTACVNNVIYTGNLGNTF